MGDAATVMNQVDEVEEAKVAEDAPEPITREQVELMRRRYRARIDSLAYARDVLRVARGNHEGACAILDAMAKVYVIAAEDMGELLGEIAF